MEIKFNQVAIITGGSMGIGAGCARVFVEAGARVVICARGRKKGEDLAAELTAKGPGSCHFEPCDVSKQNEIKNLIDPQKSVIGGVFLGFSL